MKQCTEENEIYSRVLCLLEIVIVVIDVQEVVQSCSGMLTTVAYQLGPKAVPTYALEGSVSDAGQSVKWLKESLQLFKEFADIGADLPGVG